MQLKKLLEYKEIYNNKVYDYLVDNIKNIENIFDYNLIISINDENKYISFINEFIKNLDWFYNAFLTDKIIEARESYTLIKEALNILINILMSDKFKRESVSRGYIRNLKKKFQKAINLFSKAIEISFDPKVIPFTNLGVEEYRNKILSKYAGLGKSFLFNKLGRYSFVENLFNLNLNEIAVTYRLLTNPSSNQIRTFNGWQDLGTKKTPVRILVKPKRFGKDKVYFLFKLSEHKQYKEFLNIPPNKVRFEKF